jgi:hypothetical protein
MKRLRSLHRIIADQKRARSRSAPKFMKTFPRGLRCAATSLLFGLACSGCFPLRFTTSPGAAGVVLDSQTRAPLAGAEVVVSRSTYPPPSAEEAFTNGRLPIATTGTGGDFSIAPQRGWDLFVVPIDIFPPFGLLVIKRNGYESALVPFWSRSVKPFGEVCLKPVGK